MSLANALRLYRVRLRARLVQECLAVVGIAAGVALLFASQVSSSSLQSSVGQLSHGIAGRATLQLLARSQNGFPQSVLAAVERIPGVRVASPLLEASANAVGPHGSESLQLVGAEASLAALGGTLVRHAALEPFGGVGAIVLPAPVAHTIGVTKFGQEATLELGGRAVSAPLYEVLSAHTLGALVSSPVAIAPLAFAQELAGLQGRVTRILVEPTRGSEAGVRAALQRLAAGRLNVEPLDYDQRLFAKAAAASNQSTELFAVISALVGFLFAFNAMLLTVPQRRRLIADLRRDGYPPATVIAILLGDALALGLLACALGLALGDELSIHVLRSNPAFLSLAFAIGSERAVSWESVALACGGGMLAACVAVLSPLPDILSRDPLAAISPRSGSGAGRGGPRLALAGLACLAGASLLLALAPDAAIPAMVLLVAALLLVLPFALALALALLGRVARAFTSPVAHVSAMELSAARARAMAITATGAVAVFGSVAIQGAHHDLLGGLEAATSELNASTGVWVAPSGSYNLLDTAAFAPGAQHKLALLPGVRAVQPYRSGLLDFGDRRALVIAPSSQASSLLPSTQLVQGGLAQASKRVRAGGWLVLSRGIASEHHLHVGEAFTLPSPHPTRFRIAALSTNLGWAPGAIVMNASDYARAWNSGELSAYSVVLTPGFSPTRAVGEIERALGPGSGLSAQTTARHAAAQIALSRQALSRLSQIATLILLVAVLAMAAAMGAMVWQRRPRLAKLKLEGFPRAQLWRTILLESLTLLAVGCVTGAAFGLYGQQLTDRALAQTINFPVVYSLTALTALYTLMLVCAAALAILALPGYLAAGVSPAVALQD